MDKYNVVKAFPLNGKWYHPGQKFPDNGSAVTDDTIKGLHGYFILTDAEVAKRDNPEAYAKGTELEQAQAQIGDLQAKLQQAQSSPVLSRLQDLAPKDDERDDDGFVKLVTSWRDSSSDAAKVEEAVTKHAGKQVALAAIPDYIEELKKGGDASALAAAQAEIATLRALYVADGGTELPSNFMRRGKLTPFGLNTYESLRGKTPEQLDAVEGVTLEQARQIAELVDAHFAKLEAEAKPQNDQPSE